MSGERDRSAQESDSREELIIQMTRKISDWEWSPSLASDLAHEIFEIVISSEFISKNFTKTPNKNSAGK